MASIFKCDRCSKIIDDPNYIGGLVKIFDINPYKNPHTFQPPQVPEGSKELCGGCIKALGVWFDDLRTM